MTLESQTERDAGTSPEHPRVISAYTLEEATTLNPEQRLSPELSELHETIRQRQELVDIVYYTPNGEYHQGQLVVDRVLADPLRRIFRKLFDLRIPIVSVVPIVEYNWNDDASCAANNSSAYNFRTVKGTDKLSLHSLGIAIDINPVQNPYIDNKTSQPWPEYNPTVPGTVTAEVVQLFKEEGFTWGGAWQNIKDYQHFQLDIGSYLEKLEQNPQNEHTEQERQYWSNIQTLQAQKLISS